MKKYHLVRRSGQSLTRLLIYYLIGIVISLGIGAVLLLSLGINPLEYYGRMLTIGMVGNKYAYKNFEGFLKVLVPLLIATRPAPLCRQPVHACRSLHPCRRAAR